MSVHHEVLIVRDQNVCHGQAVVKGTRVMVVSCSTRWLRA